MKDLGQGSPDISEPFKAELIDKAEKIADEIGIEYKEGVYAGFMGPYYETAAEIRSIRNQGQMLLECQQFLKQ